MKRRKFLKTTANAIAGGFWVSSCSSFGGHANNHIELAAIGCGRMGRNDIKNILAIAADHNALFTSVCDVDQNRLRAARQLIEERYAEQGIRHQVKEYSDFRKLLRNRSIDVVNIATPDHCHAEVAIAAAEAGKDIYLQKPLTYTIAEGRKLVKAVRDNKRVLQTGSQQRSSVYFRRVCELVRHGKIGELKQIEVNIGEDEGYGDGSPMEVPGSLDYRGWLGSAPYKPYTVDRVHPQNSFGRPGWMQVSDYTHGMITNWGSHMMDIAH